MIKVVPASGKQEWRINKAGLLTCYLKSPPEDGAANKELVKFLAKSLGLTQGDISIMMGATARKKLLSITGISTVKELYKKLHLEVQDALF